MGVLKAEKDALKAEVTMLKSQLKSGQDASALREELETAKKQLKILQSDGEAALLKV